MALETFISKDEEVMKLNLNLYQLMNFRESNSVNQSRTQEENNHRKHFSYREYRKRHKLILDWV